MALFLGQAEKDSALYLSSTVSERLLWFRTTHHRWLFFFFGRHRNSSLAGQDRTPIAGQAVIVPPAVLCPNQYLQKAEAFPSPQR
jgi:hypothetical protein